MSNISDSQRSASHKISMVGITDDTLTSRAGLAPFVRYLGSIGIYPHLERLFGSLRKSRKGQSVSEIFKQLFCFFADGTSSHMVYFDSLKKDEGYAGGIESSSEEMLSSHSMKRFFGKFYHFSYFLFRRLQQKLFIWRLRIEKPSVIILGLDTMVMDNDDADQREGVEPTYRKKKGFQPLQLNWRGYMIDAVFRGGDKHSNHSDTVEKMVIHVVREIRRHYREDVPILLRCDAGFFDQKLFDLYENDLRIGYICGGKLYDDIRDYVAGVPGGSWDRLEDAGSEWSYLEFADRRKNWNRFRRAFYCSLNTEQGGQYLLGFAKMDTVLYSNLGMGCRIDEQLIAAGHEDMLRPSSIITGYHGRGNDELVNRALKDFASQKLPFKLFRMNAAFYYIVLTAFFLLEAFKHDSLDGDIIPASAYATTIRRRLFDIAGKIVRHAGRIELKVTRAVMESLRFDEIWRRSNNPPLMFTWA